MFFRLMCYKVVPVPQEGGSLPNEYFCICSGTFQAGALLPLFISKQLSAAEVKFGFFGLKAEPQNICLSHLLHFV